MACEFDNPSTTECRFVILAGISELKLGNWKFCLKLFKDLRGHLIFTYQFSEVLLISALVQSTVYLRVYLDVFHY